VKTQKREKVVLMVKVISVIKCHIWRRMVAWNHSSAILNLVSGWEWATPAALSRQKHSPVTLNRKLTGLHSRYFLPLLEIKPRFLGAAHSLVSIPTELPGLPVLKWILWIYALRIEVWRKTNDNGSPLRLSDGGDGNPIGLELQKYYGKPPASLSERIMCR
jgi:hypothetical protein